MRSAARILVCLAVLWLALPSAAPAQDFLNLGGDPERPPSGPRTYGIVSEIVHTVHGFDFNPFTGTVSVLTIDGSRICSGFCGLFAGLRLPSGALVDRIELDACDTNAVQQVQFAMYRRPAPGTGEAQNITGFGTTGIAATPGCGFFTQELLSPETIDNDNYTYFLDVLSNANVNFMAVRVYHKLQVSPSPAVATFPNDVPTSHPFFRFVEALARAGITGGCAAGSYCPDMAVTRGQMAVFLAVALGLHFAP
jgi:hypothetical protein